MDSTILLFLIQDGVTNGAVYALLALGPAWQWFVPALALIGGLDWTLATTMDLERLRKLRLHQWHHRACLQQNGLRHGVAPDAGE